MPHKGERVERINKSKAKGFTKGFKSAGGSNDPLIKKLKQLFGFNRTKKVSK